MHLKPGVRCRRGANYPAVERKCTRSNGPKKEKDQKRGVLVQAFLRAIK